MAQDRLDCFVIDAERVKVCRKAAPECVPAVPLRERLVALVYMAFGFVLILLLLANDTRLERRNNDAPHKIVQVERLAVPGLEDRQAWLCEDSSAKLVRFERVRQLLHNGN